MDTSVEPRQVGPYTVLRRLGSGGMGVVYLARDPDGHLVAVKVMYRELTGEPGFRRRFRQEVAAASRVARFCTAPVLDAAAEGDPVYLVTEYVEGPTLQQTIRERGPLSGASLESVAVGMAVALDAIHGAGVLHRDLKPANVMLSPYGPKVIDFGLARVDATLSMASGLTVGTPAFMAPEQACGEPSSPATDVFSWGSVIAYAGTGRLPFSGDSIPRVLYRVVNDEPDLEGLDDRLRALVTRAMAKEPRDRPTARELLDALLGRSVDPEQAFRMAAHTWTGTAERRPRRPVLLAVAAVACAIAITGTIIGVVQSKSSVAIFNDDFDGVRGWPRSTMANATATYRNGEYAVEVGAGRGLVPTAPVKPRTLSNVTVRATARLERGDGAWGVWCYGNPPQQSRSRYDFYLTADGQTAILKEALAGPPTTLAAYTKAGNVNPRADNLLEAQCAAFENGVALRLFLNGRPVASVIDRTAPYTVGAVGVAAYAGNRPTAAAFTSFTVRRLRT